MHCDMLNFMKAVTYSRVSTSHHNQNPQVQIEELRKACTNRGWSITEELVDHGYSGSTDNRPGLKRLMSLVRSKEVDVVMVVKMDRLFRSLKHLVSTLEEFEEIGVKFVALKDNVDYSTPSGRFFVQVLGSLGEFERSLLRERTMMGLEHAKSMGKKFGRPRIHDEVRIVELHHQGKSYREIQKVTGAHMGTISRAIKNAQKSPVENTPSPPKSTALNTVVLGAEDEAVGNTEKYGNEDQKSDDEDFV